MAIIKIVNYLLCFNFLLFLVTYNPTIRHVWFIIITFFALIPLSNWFMAFTRKFALNPQLSSKGKAVLITGCDSGIGYLLAQKLDKLGYHVFASCLNTSSDGAQKLRNLCSKKLKILPLDVTKDESVQLAVNFVKQNLDNNVLWAIVNNAGVAQAGEIDWAPIEEFQRVMDVNTMGIVRVTKYFLPLLRNSKGRIVNNTSFCVHLTFPGYVGYCMSKWAANSFTSGIRVEMKKWGVKSISIEPFFYKTPLTVNEGNLKLIEETWEKNPIHIKEVYGEDYISAFKGCCKRLMKRSSPHINEVIACFVDAIGSKEPLNSYFPCYFPHKLGLSLFLYLPRWVVDAYLQWNLPSVKPKGLHKLKYAKDNGYNGVASKHETNEANEENKNTTREQKKIS